MYYDKLVYEVVNNNETDRKEIFDTKQFEVWGRYMEYESLQASFALVYKIND